MITSRSAQSHLLLPIIVLACGLAMWLGVAAITFMHTTTHTVGGYQADATGQLVSEENAPAADSNEQGQPPAIRPASLHDAETERHFEIQRRTMVQRQLAGRDITDARVLMAMERVPRHRFVSDAFRDLAYTDQPLPIGRGQTISQPYIVALMTQFARPKENARALDVGTGSGYQAAVLAELCQDVYSIEIIDALANEARTRLKELNYHNVQVRCGDGYRGWPEQAPFDLIIVAAAPDHIPKPLVEQLVPGGRLVIPVGQYFQSLQVVEKLPDGTLRETSVAGVAFVPMTGEALK